MSSPLFVTGAAQRLLDGCECCAVADGGAGHRHAPAILNGRFATHFACRNRDGRRACDWILPAAALVRAGYSVAEAAPNPEDDDHHHGSDATATTTTQTTPPAPLPVMIAEPCPASLHGVVLAAGSAFDAALVRERFVRLRITVALRSEWTSAGDDAESAAEGAADNNNSRGDYVLVLWSPNATTDVLLDVASRMSGEFVAHRQKRHVSRPPRAQQPQARSDAAPHSPSDCAFSKQSDGDGDGASAAAAPCVDFLGAGGADSALVFESEEHDRLVGELRAAARDPARLLTSCGEAALVDYESAVPGQRGRGALERQQLARAAAASVPWVVDPVPPPTLAYFASLKLSAGQRALTQSAVDRVLRERCLVRSCPRCGSASSSVGTAAAAATGSDECQKCSAAPLWSAVMPHQVRAIRYALERGGRCLLADKMGLGKTIEALGVVDGLVALEAQQSSTGDDHTYDGGSHEQQQQFRRHRFRGSAAFPVLIVCPATARGHWAEAVERWLGVDCDDIHVVFDSASAPASADVMTAAATTDDDASNTRRRRPHSPLVTIVSYSMLTRLFASHFGHAQVGTVIVDESHAIRSDVSAAARFSGGGGGSIIPQSAASSAAASSSSQQAACCSSLVRRSRHALLLSGTPLLSRPFDVFAQVDMLRPGLLGRSRLEFAASYLVVQFAPFFRPGACHRPEELRLLLCDAVMVRSTVAAAAAAGTASASAQSASGTLPPLWRDVWAVQCGDGGRAFGCVVVPEDDDIDAQTTKATATTTAVPAAATTTSHPPSSSTASFQRQYQESGLRKVDAVFARVMSDIVAPAQLRAADLAARGDDGGDGDGDGADGAGGGDALSTLRVAIFAHHHSVLDQFERLLRQVRIGGTASTTSRSPLDMDCTVSIRYLRVDGTMLATERVPALNAFLDDPTSNGCGGNGSRVGYRGRPTTTGASPTASSGANHNAKPGPPRLDVRIVLVGMTAAGVAISLHRCTAAVFAELPSDSSWMRQCEDRLHRIGQRGAAVTSHLCVDSASLFDARHLANLLSSLRSVTDVLVPTTPEDARSPDGALAAGAGGGDGGRRPALASKYFAGTRANPSQPPSRPPPSLSPASVVAPQPNRQRVHPRASSAEAAAATSLAFRVSRWTSRLHVGAAALADSDSDYESVTSCAFHEIFNFVIPSRLRRFVRHGVAAAADDGDAGDAGDVDDDDAVAAACDTAIRESAVRFVTLWCQHVKPSQRAAFPAMTLARLDELVTRADFRFVSAAAAEASNCAAATTAHPQVAVFERYLPRRLTQQEHMAWQGVWRDTAEASTADHAESETGLEENQAGGITVVRRYVRSLRCAAVAAVPRRRLIGGGISRGGDGSAAANSSDELDLLVESVERACNDEAATTISLACLHCRRAMGGDDAAAAAAATATTTSPARDAVIRMLRIDLRARDSQTVQGVVDGAAVVLDARHVPGAHWVPFCSGVCRGAWFMRRAGGAALGAPSVAATGPGAADGAASSDSRVGDDQTTPRVGAVVGSSRLRSALARTEHGECSECGVDTTALLRRLLSLPDTAQRMCLLEAEYPVLWTVPGGAAAARRLCAKPCAGNVWHADHAVPVFRGGGAALADNMQTLCVACHLAKTGYERAMFGAAATDRRRLRE